MIEFHDIQRLGRIALTALCIGTGAVALSALPLGGMAQAKNSDHGGGQGDHGGGHGNSGGNANGHSIDHDTGQQHGTNNNGAASDNAGTDTSADADTSDDDTSLTAHGLGKLNGFFHASPQALANASPNSSIGRISDTFREALSAFAAAAATDQSTTGDQTTTTGDTTAAPPAPTAEDLGAILAGATNKPVTAAQVQAIAGRLAALHPEDTALADFAANADEADCQKIADAANAAQAGSDTTTTDDTTDNGDTTTTDTTTTGTTTILTTGSTSE